MAVFNAPAGRREPRLAGADDRVHRAPEWAARLAAITADTPALLLDLDAFERNLATMAAFARGAGVALRPHAKTHKCAEIGKRQMAAGAVGLCCAKLSEAEALADAGCLRLTVTSPVVNAAKIARLAMRAGRVEELMVVADTLEVVPLLGRAARDAKVTLAVLVDLDVGQNRSGAGGPAAAVEVARRIAAEPGLAYAGVQAYAGHVQHIAGLAARRAASQAACARLRDCLTALRQAGMPPAIVTGSGTGAFALDVESGFYTELQVGSYAFLDDEYLVLEPAGPQFERSAFVLAEVVSRRQPGIATVDVGTKGLSADGPLPSVLAPSGLRYERAGDEFGHVLGPPAAIPALAGRVLLGLPHCDPTINMYDAFVCLRDGRVAETWPVTARGCSA